MADVEQRWKWPTGSVSKTAGRNIVLGLTGALILFLAFCGGSSTPVSRPGSKGVAQPGSPEEAQRAEAELTRQVREARTRPVPAPLSSPAQATSVATDPVTGLPQQAPVDPMEQARLQADVELYKQRRARALASPLVFAAAPEVVATAPSAIGAEPEAAVAEVAIPKAPALPVKDPAAPKQVLREGTIVEAVLVNRLDSTFSGPVIVQVSNDVPDADRTGVLIPKGTRILGSAAAVNSLGQSRMAISFHRMIRPDNVAIDLTKFPALNQIGETGMKDKVNRHYLQIFGVSIALGVIGALAQGSASYGYQTGGWDVVRGGAGVGMSRSAEQVLNRLLNIPPTVTIREGHRVKVYIMADLSVPPYGGSE